MFSLDVTNPNAMDPDAWDRFQDKLREEVKGIKWTAAMPDLVPKIAELFDIPVSDVFIASWKKAEALSEQIEASKKAPKKIFYFSLSEHAVTSEFHPRIDVKIPGKTIKGIVFTVRLSLKLDAFELRIKNGAITHIGAGRYGGEGSIHYGDLRLMSKEFLWHELPSAIPIAA
jgi:hypothetical protein